MVVAYTYFFMQKGLFQQALREVNLATAPYDNRVIANCARLIDISKTAACFVNDSRYVPKDVSYKEYRDFVNQKMEVNQ
jgi:hypothetical protein